MIDYVIMVEANMVRDNKDRHYSHATQQPLPAFSVNVALPGIHGHPKSRPLLNSDFRKLVVKWCDEHCIGARYIGKKKTIHFELEEDALLFWFSHERKHYG